MSRKKIVLIITFIISFLFIMFDTSIVSAREVVAKRTTTNIFGETLGVIFIYDNGEISVDYKYGLKQVDVSYCLKGESCDNSNYNYNNILQSNSNNMHKNTDAQNMANFTYKLKASQKGQYRIRVEAYFGSSASYDASNFMYVSAKQTLDTGDIFVNIASSNGIDSEGLSKTLDQIVKIVNTIVLPILYGLISIVLVIKGALIGTAIVKSADDPNVRQEKIKSLKWLFIGVAVAYAASSVVGVITGFFKDLF